MRKVFRFDELYQAPLIIDAIYEGGDSGNVSDDPLSKLLKGIGNLGGFRIAYNQIDKNPAFIVLYTSEKELEWPDYIDYQSGVFKYYGDNRHPGHELHDTPKRGNQILKQVFDLLQGSAEDRKNIPPFLVFKKIAHERSRSVSFLGLAVPGREGSSPGKDLLAIWRTKGSVRFQNYEAYFTILDASLESVSKEWLEALRDDRNKAYELAPQAWNEFIHNGLSNIKPLKAPKVKTIRKRWEQLPRDEDINGWELLLSIYNYFKPNPFAFEKFAVKITKMMDGNFNHFDLTRPWRDGGRDAMGTYTIGIGTDKLSIICALEAKCYNPKENGCGVKLTTRLISRIKYREFGIFVTTSWINDQAYKEIKEDRHPVLVISGIDILNILREHDLGSIELLKIWLENNFKLN